jgi:hypothetical protein
MQKILCVTLMTISGLCSASDYFDKKYYSDFYCIKLAAHSKRLANNKEDPEIFKDKELLEAVKLARKAALGTEPEITNDQKEDLEHVIDIVYDNDYYYLHNFSETTFKYCIDKYITKR